jgi:plasmid stabilization system protein ParE
MVIRYTRRARSEVYEGWKFFADHASEVIADQWEEELEEAISHLASSLIGEIDEDATQLLGKPTRKMVFRRRGSAVAYQVYYQIREDPLDAPTIQIMHIRHGARKNITREESLLIKEAD